MVKRKTLNRIMAAAVVLLILVGVLLSYNYFFKDEVNGGMLYDTKAVNSNSSTNVSEQQTEIILPSIDTIEFKADSTTQDINLSNSSSNECLMSFDLYIDEETTPVYRSGYVEPGMVVSQIEMYKTISKGSHSLNIKISFYDEDNKTLLSTAQLSNNLVIN